MVPRCFALSALAVALLGQTPQQTPQNPPWPTPSSSPTIRPQITAPDENPPPRHAQAPGSPRTVEIPLLDCSGIPCIDMSTGSGKTLRLLIDTGEANSYLDTKAAQALGVDLQPLKGGDNSTISEVQQTVVPGAKLGDLAMGDFPFLVLDTTQQPDKLGEKPQPLPGDGALTYRAFQNRLLEIDYPHHLVRISSPEEAGQACPQNCSDLLIKHFGNYGPATLTAGGFTVNGQAVDVQIDTLFTGTMLIYPTAVEKLGLKKESKGKHKEFFPYTQGGVKLGRFDGAAESFRDMPLMQDAPLYFFTSDDHPPAVQFDATVGSGLLSHAIVTFDFKGMHMWMMSATAPASQTTSPPGSY